MKTLLDVPFYPNTTGDGNQCYQVAMKSVIKYFLNKEMSSEELDKLTKRKEGFWTYTPQVVPPLYDLGLNVKCYSKSALEPFLEGESYIRKYYGKDAEQILQHTDLEAMIWSIKNMQKYNLFEVRVLRYEEIEKHLREGHVPICLVNHKVILGKEGPYQGHAVTLTGFDSDNVYLHDSGPKDPTPNMKVKKQVFIEAWNANGTDNDVVITFGKRI